MEKFVDNSLGELLTREYNKKILQTIDGLLLNEILTPEATTLLILAKESQLNRSMPSKEKVEKVYEEEKAKIKH